MSPGCGVKSDQSIEFLFSLGGVPVFNLPTLRFKLLSLEANMSLDGSPTRPPGDCSRPVCITPPRNVPVVKMIVFPNISAPSSV